MKEEQIKNKNGAIEMDYEPPETDDPFQEVMAKAGNHGRFQMIYNIIFIMGLATAGSMVYMNIILALNIPDHWCTVPGREKTNYTVEEWRNITLPTETDNRGASTYSMCKMYTANFTEITDWSNWNSTQKMNETVCENGWTYDEEWYASTIPSEQNWVCEKDLFITNIFVVSRVVEVIGAFVFGQVGDAYGRRIVFYCSVLACSVGRIASIVTTNSYTWFLIFSGVAALTVNSLFQSPQIVGMEISREKDRSTIAVYQSFGWSVGTTFMPLLFWWLREWEPFMWITTVPTFLVLIFAKYIIESPRWLISKRRFGDAIAQFKIIAKINGRPFDMSEKELAHMYPESKHEMTYGMASLFSGWRLAKNTSIMAFSWCVVACSYFTLVLFSSRMGGNPFLNFLLQSIVEIPAYMLGKYSGDKYGRRFTNTMCFILSFIACIPVIIYSPYKEYENVMTGLATFIKFLNAMTFFTANLQCMEMYPTCLRQTGISLGTILANAVGVFAPYLVYLGTTVDIRAPYWILGTLFLIGGIGASFLPETLHRKLPDTMEDARTFGKDDKFWSLPKAPPRREEAAEKLNQAAYAP